MARDPNKPTRMDGILNNIPKILEELTYPPESVDRRFSNATAKTLEPFYKPNLINDNRVPQPSFPLSILEGRGVQFVESDRTMAGPTLVGIGNQPLARPLDLNTGVDHIFYPGQPTTVNGPRGSLPIWASAPGVVNKFLKRAAELEKTTGQPTFLLPFEGGYKSNDWWTGTGKAMINYNLANAPDDALQMQEQILKDRIPNWPGSADPMAMTVWEATPGAVRMGITQELDQLKNVGGLSEGQARVATSRVESLNSPMGTIGNIGLLDTQADYLLNKSPDYGATLMGKPVGVLDTPVTAFDFTREQTTATGQPLNIRALQMRDTSKVISPEEVSKVVTYTDLRDLEDKGVDIDKGIKVRSPGPLGIIAGGVATIMGTGYSGQEVEAGVIDTAKKVVAADAKTTQRANTVNTAKSAAAYLKNQGASGKSLDYGAGHGINAKAMGFDETFEPFAGEGFTPTYTSGKDIPRGEYGQIVSTNVLNVIPPTDVIDGQMFRPRDMAVLNIGDALQDGGMAVIQTRSASAVNELKKSKTAIPQDESGAFVTSRGSYQKGFTRPELQEYVQGVLGDGFGVEIVPAKDISAGSAVKVVKLGRFNNPQAAVTSAVLGTGLLGASEESDASILGPLSKLGAGRQDLLGMAKKMANEGVDEIDIRSRTGWELGADGQWRTELPNTKTKLNIPEIPEGRKYYKGTIADIVDDPELLSQYETGGRKPTVRDMDGEIEEYGSRGTYGPLGDIEFIVDRNMPADTGFHKEGHVNSNGEWSPEIIVISGKSSPAEQRATVLHELQHAIQDREGFAAGGAARNFKEEEKIRDAFYKGVGLTPAGSKRLQELEAKSNEVGQGSMSVLELYELERLKVEKQISDRFNVETVGEAGARSPYGMYRGLMGEVEARNVETRDRMSPDFLKQTPLEFSEDVFEPRSQQIFRAGSDDELTNELAFLDIPNFRSDASSLDDDFARMQKNADGGIINQMMAKNARSQQLAEYGDALKSRRKLDSVSKMINKRLDSKGPLVGEIIARETENFTKLIVGLVPMIASPDSTFYQDVTQSKSLLGDPSEGYNTVMDTIAKGMQTYVLEPAKKALDYKGSDDKSVRQEIAETIQPAIDAYKTLPETVQEEVMPRLGYLGALVGSLYGFGLANKAKQTVRQGQSGEGVLGRFSPIEGELVDTPTPAIDVRQPAGLLQ